MLPGWRPSGPTIARSGFRMTRARAEAERAVRPSDAPARDHFQAGVGRDTYRLVGLGAWLEPEHLRAGVDGLARDGDRLRGGPEDIDDVDGSVAVAAHDDSAGDHAGHDLDPRGRGAAVDGFRERDACVFDPEERSDQHRHRG